MKTMTATICDMLAAGGLPMRKGVQRAAMTRRFMSERGFFDPAQVVKRTSKARKKKK